MKLKVFISSRNNDEVIIGNNPGESLTDIRIWLKDELEKTQLFENDLLEIRINESFGADTSKDSYNQCLEEVKESDFLISLYNGVAGWAPAGIDFGICHAELSHALDISTQKTAIIDVRDFFDIKPADEAEELRNQKFREYIETQNRFTNPLKVSGDQTNENFKNSLLESIRNVIHKHLADRIKIANIYYNLSGNNRVSLDWKKLKYADRNRLITDRLKTLISNSPNFSTFITQAYSVPDNMSVEDAKSYTGRPFLKDQDLIPPSETDLRGPIHFIGVYGNATEIQVKKLIGFPDISAIRDDFGLYVWEQNTHVQLVFLVGCKTPEAINSSYLLFNNWCESTGEIENIAKRAEARFHILRAINEAKTIAI